MNKKKKLNLSNNYSRSPLYSNNEKYIITTACGNNLN